MKVFDRVLQLLRDCDLYRNSDLKLTARIWYNDLPEHLRTDSVKEFLREYAKGRLSNSESIRRSRQKVQETHPELRGVNWEARQRHGREVSKAMKECPGYMV